MKHLITIVAFISCLLSTTHAQKEIPPMPYEVVLYETVNKFCSEHSAQFSEWSRAYLKKVVSERGITYPRSGAIYSPSNKNQERANKIAFYAAIRSISGDTLHTLSEDYVVFKVNTSAKKAKPSTPARGRGF